MERRSSMFDGMRIGSFLKIDIEKSRVPRLKDMIKIKGLWTIEHYRGGQLIGKHEASNLITLEGLKHVLDTVLHAGTAITAWYVMLYENNQSPAYSMTYAVPIVTEFEAYDEATRPAYVEAVAASVGARAYITNAASKAVFTVNDTKSIYGGGLVGGGSSADTKGDVAGGGVLFNLVRTGGTISVIDEDVLNVTIQISLETA
jgi:hypothetical protein